MRRSTVSLLVISLITAIPALGDHIYVSGDVSGTWSADTVFVTGEIRVPPGDALTIEPGIRVLFQVYCKFMVDTSATLVAMGNQIDSIYFDVLAPNSNWHGIRFMNASDNSVLSYCHISNGSAFGGGGAAGGGIYCENSAIRIEFSLITNCHAYAGGAIFCNNESESLILGNSISGNTAVQIGGGIVCTGYSNPVIRDNFISQNEVDNGEFTIGGGGVYCDSSNPLIEDNQFTDNYAAGDGNGGGIGCLNASPVITGNTFTGNQGSFGGGIGLMFNSQAMVSENLFEDNSSVWGGGICCYESNSLITDNSFNGNTAGVGGAVYISDSDPTIQNNLIIGNSANSNGGAIACEFWASPTINNNFIFNNHSDLSGGGVLCYNFSDTEISNNQIIGNSAGTHGGGISCWLNTFPTIENNIICENVATLYGGGVFCYLSDPAITNCTIGFNNAEIVGGGVFCDGSYPTIANSVLWGNAPQQYYQYVNQPISYCDILGGWTGEGNIDADPLFETGPLSDYHLSATSPCIDAGNPDAQYNDPEDPQNPGYALWPALGTIRNDMGAYGGGGALGWVGVTDNVERPLPGDFSLEQNYPNPFNPVTTIQYSLPVPGYVSLKVLDVQGRLVDTLIEGWRWAGRHEATLDGSAMASGLYFYVLQAGQFHAVKKMVLLK